MQMGACRSEPKTPSWPPFAFRMKWQFHSQAAVLGPACLWTSSRAPCSRALPLLQYSHTGVTPGLGTHWVQTQQQPAESGAQHGPGKGCAGDQGTGVHRAQYWGLWRCAGGTRDVPFRPSGAHIQWGHQSPRDLGSIQPVSNCHSQIKAQVSTFLDYKASTSNAYLGVQVNLSETADRVWSFRKSSAAKGKNSLD